MYNYCNPQEIKPTGWLRRQLEIQAKGLAGNLDKMWPDVRKVPGLAVIKKDGREFLIG